MGWLDAITDLADIAKDIVTLPVEIGKAAIETCNDIQEAVTQDIQNKLTGNPDKEIRTSYDIRGEADQIISKVQNEYVGAKNQLNSEWTKLVKKSNIVTGEREKVYSLVGQAIYSIQTDTLPPSSEIAGYYPSEPSIDTLSFDIGTYFGTGGTGMRMEAAEEYLEEAKEYRVEVKEAISKLNVLKRAAIAMCSAYDEELEMLELIRNSYTVRSEAVLIQSADIMHEIAGSCLEEVNTHTYEKYSDLVKRLKELWG